MEDKEKYNMYNVKLTKDYYLQKMVNAYQQEVELSLLKTRIKTVSYLYSIGSIRDEDYKKFILSEDINYYPPLIK